MEDHIALEACPSEASSTFTASYEDHRKTQMELTEKSQPPHPLKKPESSSEFLLDLKLSNEKSVGGSKVELNLFKSINPSSPPHANSKSIESSGKI
ncbi:hypothetical protein L484_020737 [Morus notabilis]|uniref:Uncharacterized protein n=1 Tax=Morus notabilis TaxID=981085 RepID=W9QUF4_9ROSA|nr:hypothetical protein L484_020737 [Morus notabilis]